MTQLPSIKPAQIKAARTLKKYLTGDLNAPVSTFPPFPGNEAVFLRAQIARIVATTVICPNGLFQMGEDEVTLEKNEEFEPLPSTDLLLKENWAHRYPHLKKQGRCELYVKEVDEDEEGEEEPPEPTEEETEEGPELLSTLDNDVPLAAEADPWTPLTSSINEQVKFQVMLGPAIFMNLSIFAVGRSSEAVPLRLTMQNMAFITGRWASQQSLARCCCCCQGCRLREHLCWLGPQECCLHTPATATCGQRV